MANVCRLHKLEQGMPKGSVPSSMHRPGRGPHCRVRTPEFSRCLLRLSPDPSHQGGSARHHIHHSLRMLLLCEDTVWVEEHGGTCQRCMQFCFKEQIEHNLEVYVDDIIIKTRQGVASSST
jgi:hypothetical protein